MKKIIILFGLFFLLVMGATPGLATNGDNLMAIGPIARSMGGVGIAAPQDAISAVFANPAAMCFGPYCPGSEFNFAGTVFMPKVDAKITLGGTTFQANSAENIYPIPAIGISVPITKNMPLWRFGLAAYGVTGSGCRLPQHLTGSVQLRGVRRESPDCRGIYQLTDHEVRPFHRL